MSKSENKKQFIIETAALLINEKGIAGTSVDDIIAAAKTSKGCFYGHFESKEELSYACADYLLGRMEDRTAKTLAKHKTAAAKIGAFMDNNKNPLNTFIEGGCPIVNLSTESDDTNLVIKKKVKAMIENSIALFTGIVQDGISRGELSDELDPEEFATKMFLAIEGGNAFCRTLGSNAPMRTVIGSLKKELAGYAVVAV